MTAGTTTTAPLMRTVCQFTGIIANPSHPSGRRRDEAVATHDSEARRG